MQLRGCLFSKAGRALLLLAMLAAAGTCVSAGKDKHKDKHFIVPAAAVAAPELPTAHPSMPNPSQPPMLLHPNPSNPPTFSANPSQPPPQQPAADLPAPQPTKGKHGKKDAKHGKEKTLDLAKLQAKMQEKLAKQAAKAAKLAAKLSNSDKPHWHDSHDSKDSKMMMHQPSMLPAEQQLVAGPLAAANPSSMPAGLLPMQATLDSPHKRMTLTIQKEDKHDHRGKHSNIPAAATVVAAPELPSAVLPVSLPNPSQPPMLLHPNPSNPPTFNAHPSQPPPQQPAADLPLLTPEPKGKHGKKDAKHGKGKTLDLAKLQAKMQEKLAKQAAKAAKLVAKLSNSGSKNDDKHKHSMLPEVLPAPQQQPVPGPLAAANPSSMPAGLQPMQATLDSPHQRMTLSIHKEDKHEGKGKHSDITAAAAPELPTAILPVSLPNPSQPPMLLHPNPSNPPTFNANPSQPPPQQPAADLPLLTPEPTKHGKHGKKDAKHGKEKTLDLAKLQAKMQEKLAKQAAKAAKLAAKLSKSENSHDSHNSKDSKMMMPEVPPAQQQQLVPGPLAPANLSSMPIQQHEDLDNSHKRLPMPDQQRKDLVVNMRNADGKLQLPIISFEPHQPTPAVPAGVTDGYEWLDRAIKRSRYNIISPEMLAAMMPTAPMMGGWR